MEKVASMADLVRWRCPNPDCACERVTEDYWQEVMCPNCGSQIKGAGAKPKGYFYRGLS